MNDLWKSHKQECWFTGNPTTLTSSRDPDMNLYYLKKYGERRGVSYTESVRDNIPITKVGQV